MYVRFLSPCSERGGCTHPVVHPESDELQQGGVSGEGVPSLRQHGVLRERDPVVQGIRDEDGNWSLLGTQVATSNVLTFKNVPSGGLYVLRDKTKGHEQRIFTYEKEEQVWW